MNTTITGRHFEVSEPLRMHIEQKTGKLRHFFDGIVTCDITMSVEKHRHLAEITANLYDHTLRSSHESDDMTLSVDKALEKMERQLKRVHDKLRGPHRINKEDLLSNRSEEEEKEEE